MHRTSLGVRGAHLPRRDREREIFPPCIPRHLCAPLQQARKCVLSPNFWCGGPPLLFASNYPGLSQVWWLTSEVAALSGSTLSKESWAGAGIGCADEVFGDLPAFEERDVQEAIFTGSDVRIVDDKWARSVEAIICRGTDDTGSWRHHARPDGDDITNDQGPLNIGGN